MTAMTYSDKRVLVVEDQRPFLLLLRGLINSLGAKSVMTAANGEAAIAACRKEKFDIVIADLHLGSGKKNGFELIEELRSRRLTKATTVFVIISADSERPMVLGSLDKQPDAYLIKPFSQHQLHVRLSKAFAQKQALAEVYHLVQQDKIDEAIDACRQIITQDTKHRRICSQMLSQLYWRSGKYQEAEHMLSALNKHKPVLWVTLAMARTYLLMENYKQAAYMARKAILLNKNTVEAFDILAQSQLKQDLAAEAKETIAHALMLSPLSIERQFSASEIARANQDFELINRCCQAIWQQSKRTIHRDIAHFCTYVRSFLDIAERAEDKKHRNRYQQEALLALQRGRHDEALARIDDSFDHGLFEKIINARVNFLDGKLMESKRHLAQSQQGIEKKFDDYPLYLAPDSIKIMLDLGEFEDAQGLLELLNNDDSAVDVNTQALLAGAKGQSQGNQQQYRNHNHKGIKLYNEGKFDAAYEEFKKAQHFSPVNTGIALNLLQCLLKLLEMRDKPDAALLNNCRQTYKLIEGIPLTEAHREKLDTLEAELSTHLRLK